MKLTIEDIITAGTVAKAIEAAAKVHDSISSGIVGPSFSTSGPGPGWSKPCTATDYAARALSDEHGAQSYIDSADGREATLDSDGSVVWSEASVVELVAPSAEEIDDDPDVALAMVHAIESGHCIEETTRQSHPDWSNARALMEYSESDALARIDGEIVGGSVLYYDDSTHRWYLSDREDLVRLRILMGDVIEDIACSAYSYWCAECGHGDGYEDEDEARAAASAKS